MLDTSSERGRILRRCAEPRLVRRQSGARSTRAWLVRIGTHSGPRLFPGTSIGVSCGLPDQAPRGGIHRHGGGSAPAAGGAAGYGLT
jgi:hypothetical protein